MNVFFGCDRETIKQIKPVNSKEFEFSIGSNFLEWLYPNEKTSALKPITIDDFIQVFEGLNPGSSEEINAKLS